MSRRFLLDTNHLGAAVDPRLPVLERLQSLHQRGYVFGTCMPALAEVEVGFEQTPHPDWNREALVIVRRYVRLWPLLEPYAAKYARTFMELRRRGRTLSMADLFLAVMCREMNLILLSTDRDFEALPDIHVENWLSVSSSSGT